MVVARRAVLIDQFLGLTHGVVIEGNQLLVFLLDRVIGVDNVDGKAGVFSDEIADGDRLIRGQGGAQKTDKQITHNAANLSPPEASGKEESLGKSAMPPYSEAVRLYGATSRLTPSLVLRA
jgi:hypothetical protein